MSFRSRIFAVSALVTLLPLTVLALAVRGEMAAQLTGQYDRRVAALLSRVQSDLTARGDEIALRLDALETRLADDNTFRLAAVARVERERLYLLDYAVKVMGLMGLSMLQIQDADARILSSGHFRNQYGTLEPGLPALLRRAPGGVALTMARRPAGPFLALVRGARFEVAGRPFTVIGGVEVRRDFLTSLVKDRDLVLSLVYPGGALSTDAAVQDRLAAEVARSAAAGGAEPPVWRRVLPASEHVVRTAELPFTAALGGADALTSSTATILVSYPRAPLTSMLHRLDLYLAAVLAASAGGSLLLAMWFSAAVSRPIARLARRTAEIDLDHLDADFSTTRRDEVGMLSRFLAVMLERLRSSSQALRDAERRATRGEIARQVNHDLCNGLTPIRNVVTHLTQVARDEPAQLAQVLQERHRTLEASISYLDGLADNYRRLSGHEVRSACDLNEVVRQAVSSIAEVPGVELRLRLDPDLPRVLAGEVSLRRIVENLVRNACEAVGSDPGTVTITTGVPSDEAARPAVLLAVADTGPGVSEDLRHRIFDEFFSTKPSGDGLGLAIVRRLVRDAGGSIELDGESRDGARFTVLLPVSGAQS